MIAWDWAEFEVIQAILLVKNQNIQIFEYGKGQLGGSVSKIDIKIAANITIFFETCFS